MGVRQIAKVTNKQGLHARPSTRLVEIANRYKSEVTLNSSGQSANAKSVISVLTLGVLPGSDVEVHAEGADELDAVKAICDEINRGFGLLDDES